MQAQSNAALSILQATALARRCHNPYFRREQLKALHDALRNKAQDLRDAIKQQANVTDHEVSLEVASALQIVKSYHAEIDPTKEIEKEYRTSKGVDALDKTEPWGVVYVEPDWSHTPFFNTLVAVSAALANGNCVLLLLQVSCNMHQRYVSRTNKIQSKGSETLTALLQDIFAQALQSDTFQVVESRPDAELLARCFCVLQASRLNSPTQTQLTAPTGRVFAVVDRTANLAEAAESIVTARFAFGGQSPYAPDLVLVNEFVKDDFVEQILQKTDLLMAKNLSSKQSRESDLEKAVKLLGKHKHWQSTVISRKQQGAIVDLKSLRTTYTALPDKVEAPILSISSISSLDHAIDIIATTTDGQPLLAGYHFAAHAHAKYLSQFIPANLSFVNHVPHQLLLGPAAPFSGTFDIERRYTKEQFARPSPVFSNTIKSSVSIERTKTSTQQVTRMFLDATSEIKEPKRGEWSGPGFFEQGIFIGLGLYGVPVLACLGASLFMGVKTGLNLLTG